MVFTQTRIPGVLVIELEKREDSRGYFARAWCEREFAAHGLPRFVQTNMSMCRQKGTIRGLHYQAPPHGEAKYLRCIRGAIFDVVVDIRPDSPTYRKWFGIELTADNRKAIFVPEGLPHAYQALSDQAEVIYSASSFYTPGAERGIRWNDPAFKIDWPIREVIVSEKDASWADWQG
ncbi:MAG TPA: dTDP-4-dehydrorhamnose 3,5-epimerase [Tepidisphaeraceae bacterium]|nr:dTDP-4-dehydrorhamnose 3,5-epimerase [Tepidisphaeraceae bacterium]